MRKIVQTNEHVLLINLNTKKKYINDKGKDKQMGKLIGQLSECIL
jgi:hypothetical protein